MTDTDDTIIVIRTASASLALSVMLAFLATDTSSRKR